MTNMRLNETRAGYQVSEICGFDKIAGLILSEKKSFLSARTSRNSSLAKSFRKTCNMCGTARPLEHTQHEFGGDSESEALWFT